MSRLSKKPIVLSDNIKVKIEHNICSITGPLGTIDVPCFSNVKFGIKNNEIIFGENDVQKASALSGLLHSLIKNAITGVTTGHKKVLELKGLGYRCNLEKNTLNLSLGYSHKIVYELPSDIKLAVEKDTIIKIEGIDKQRVGQVAAEIRSFKIPDNYHAKGILYQGEVIITKEGKKK